MFRYSFVILCAVLVLSNVAFINAKRSYSGGGGRHASYPKPSPGGLSGSGGRGGHAYPPSGGFSGTGHGGGGSYPSSHGYPSQGGSSGGHGYPAGGNSGNHGYPASGGLSGSNTRYQGGKANNPSGTTTNIHHHYHYSPPQQIHYASPHGGPAMSYPVYRGAPPTYVYQYKDSGSKYGTLLAGLALLNLGVLAGGIAGHSHSHSQTYTPRKGEVCLFGIKKDNGDYEETRIDCQLITSFIYQEEAAAAANKTVQTSVVSTTITNSTTVNATNPSSEASPGPVNINVNFTMLPNGTLIPVNVYTNGTVNATGHNPAAPAGDAASSSVTTITTNTTTTVVSALDAKGAPVSVTPGMQCYVIRRIPSSSVMKKTVPCGLLQTYADKSLKRNSASRNVPAFTILAVMCAAFVMH